jgi:hypothetical protein
MNYNNINFFKNYNKYDDNELDNILKVCNHFSLFNNYNLGIDRLEVLRKSSLFENSFEEFLKGHIIHVRLEEDVICYSLKYLGIDILLESLDEGVNFGMHSEELYGKLSLVSKLSK